MCVSKTKKSLNKGKENGGGEQELRGELLCKVNAEGERERETLSDLHFKGLLAPHQHVSLCAGRHTISFFFFSHNEKLKCSLLLRTIFCSSIKAPALLSHINHLIVWRIADHLLLMAI